MKKFYLFGNLAVHSYEETNTVNEIILNGIEFELFKWNENSEPSSLLCAYDGWDGFCEIDEVDYNDLEMQL